MNLRDSKYINLFIHFFISRGLNIALGDFIYNY